MLEKISLPGMFDTAMTLSLVGSTRISGLKIRGVKGIASNRFTDSAA